MPHAARAILPLLVASLTAASASAGLPYTVTYDAPFTGFGSGIPLGGSIPNENFAIARNETLGIEIGTQAFERFGSGLDNIDELYFAPPGNAPTSPTNPAPSVNADWNINWGVILPSAFRNWDIDLSVDFDPGVGAQDLITLDMNSILDGLGLSAVASTQNIGAAFWQSPGFGAPPFDANAPGEYDVILTVHDLDGNLSARSAIVVRVVPAPGSAAVLGLCGLLAARRRRLADPPQPGRSPKIS